MALAHCPCKYSNVIIRCYIKMDFLNYFISSIGFYCGKSCQVCLMITSQKWCPGWHNNFVDSLKTAIIIAVFTPMSVFIRVSFTEHKAGKYWTGCRSIKRLTKTKTTMSFHWSVVGYWPAICVPSLLVAPSQSVRVIDAQLRRRFPIENWTPLQLLCWFAPQGDCLKPRLTSHNSNISELANISLAKKIWQKNWWKIKGVEDIRPESWSWYWA